MLSSNEWDPLKTVIIGIADDAKVPKIDTGVRTVNYADKIDVSSITPGLYPKQVIDEANEDLEILVNFLKKEHIKVYRPDKNLIPNYYNYCPRDSVLVTDEGILTTPMSLEARENEWRAVSHVLNYYTYNLNISNVANRDSLYNLNCIGNPNTLALNNTVPCFDAANILRANDDLYYLVSNTGNELGAQYLQEVFPNKRVHIIKDIYSYIHIDSTIAFLREGLMLLNPSRVKNIEQLPKSLHNWDVIYCPNPYDIGHYPGYCNASPWININLLSINTNLVVLEENQHDTRKVLEKYNIECAMLPMRHARTLGGCFHCVSLDIERNEYF